MKKGYLYLRIFKHYTILGTYYWPTLTIKVILRDEEPQEMIQNHSSIPFVNSTGELKAKVLGKDGLSGKQIQSAMTNRFQTSEVFKTLTIK